MEALIILIGEPLLGPFNPRGLPSRLKGISKYRQYSRLDPSHPGKGWHFDGLIGKFFDKLLKIAPALSVSGDTIQECSETNKCP